MTDISGDEVERLTPYGLINDNGQVEAVMEARKNGKYVLYSAYATQAARIEQLEAAMATARQTQEVYVTEADTARADALRDLLAHKWLCFHSCDFEVEVVSVSIIEFLINKEPTT